MKGLNIYIILRAHPFDNLDSLYEKYCGKFILDNEPFDNEVELAVYYPFIYELISIFTVGVYSNLGIRCVFAARNETTDLIRNGLSLDDGDRSPFDVISHFIKLNPTTGRHIHDVIQRRMDLIIDNVNDEDTSNQIESNKNSLPDNEAFERINVLSIQGLRHTMSVCRRISWSLLSDNLIFDRYFTHKFATKLVHYLGGKTHYSQANQGISNIFLVSNAYRKGLLSSTGASNDWINKHVIDDHMHTYWLKYLILMYINTSNVDKGTVIKAFTNEGKRGYEKELVKLVLYSLTEVQHGRLIEPDISFGNGISIVSSGFKCTDRAKHLIDENVFFSFCYLSAIIEDEWLEYPTYLKTLFSEPFGFHFLFYTDNDQYKNEFYEFLLNKADRVLAFLDILEVSYKFEKKKYRDIFILLNKHGVVAPDFSAERERIFNKISDLSGAISPEKQSHIMNKIYEIGNSRIRNNRISYLNKTFKKVYYTGAIGRTKLLLSNSINR